ncbi:5-oxoprolinase/urea amidolyase family protein [Epidermidibacterium keratini]|uniref:5-oxoprolinase/urea amidolyase family protein n=1 Tax=Epidermidibacterium keratini TaxID=1891644 RepID=A0A7L4YP38_9ACTN|nr:biotin-dependent carboxyltransferase family protein [Epidermidibacterium keratini]QHC00838.1 5-oxoprolinase/urea amidolyase family protein [Epidermidibacterium keratini]
MTRSLRVEAPGGRTTVQDEGRPGLAELGVGRSGAADRAAYSLANRIVGNDAGSACLELTLGGLVLTSDHATWMAVTGPRVDVRVDDEPVGSHTAFFVAAGARVAIGVPAAGLRNYLAVRGGIAVEPVLGSRSRDILGRIGPPELTAGDVLPVGATPARPPAGIDIFPFIDPSPRIELRVDPGPRIDWFTDDAWAIFSTAEYAVTFDSDRVGVRLDGPTLSRRITDELPSEGLMQGAVQIPPAGTPVVFLADQPTTGGYPVIAVVRRSALDRLAQARPGDTVRFVAR